ncbi:concanavalin A-like lectin/glucanase domain-containing protein [Abortiporus biennis]|nr:concanavalin A-like lectin/glucanase domain-containing protein [Abortiporus biennis]
MVSSRLPQKLTADEKPWMKEKDKLGRISWWLTLATFFIGIAVGAVVCFFGWTGVKQLKDSDLCPVLMEDFDSLDLDNVWTRDVELGGFGNGEFQMTTNYDKNLQIQNGELYIIPTLTSDEIGGGSVNDGYTYPLPGCTTANRTACTAVSSSSRHTVINPVQSARISTKGHYTIGFGKVEVRAKLPRGDWLWPAIWMLPEDDSVYGPWPVGGEIDIMEARGNGPTYPAQGSNFVRSSLNYGPFLSLQTHMVGWWSQKQSSYDKDFHVYSMEWTPDWMRFYVDSKLQATMNVKITGKGGKSFFDAGGYPPTALNGTSVPVVVEDIWAQKSGSAAAPFDQQFYLILDLAAGGTSGWFPDKVGDKPWFDGSATAMADFANAQGTWSSTWPSDVNDLAFRM